MISPEKFKKLVVDELEKFFPMTGRKEDKEKQVDDLYEMFKNTSESVLKAAIIQVKLTHKFQRFPYPADIANAIDSARKDYVRDSIDPDLPQEKCPICENMGIVLEEKWDAHYKATRKVAVPCTCRAGEKVREAWKQHDKKRGYRRGVPKKPVETL